METNSDSVLIADDNHISLDLLKGLLASLGYVDIKCVMDGDAAIASYQGKKSDILFLDINMPVKSGLDTLKEIRAVDPNAFVVIVSGECSAANIQQSLALGAQGFVVKPYSVSRVKEALDKYRKGKTSV
ncbi:MAG: response regulator [Burkholderiales bacterium]|nr:response regulator [Burkholderiales bacterium]